MTRLRKTAGDRDDRIVATLRHELLVPLPDDVAAAHLEAMLLERDFDRAAGRNPEPDTRPVDPPRLRARTLIGAGVLAAALTLTSGFAAAGALPATAQHWISRATRVIGIPLPDAPRSRPAPRPAPRTPARQPSLPPTPTVGESGARPTPPPTIATHRPARPGGSAAPAEASKRGGAAAAKAPAANVPKAHGPADAAGNGNGNGKKQADADDQNEGGQNAPKVEKPAKSVAPKASKKADKKSGSAEADDDQGEDGNAAASARGSDDG